MRQGHRHLWSGKTLERYRKWWWLRQSPAYHHYHGVITEGVPPSWWNRVAFKSPYRSLAYRVFIDGKAAWRQ